MSRLTLLLVLPTLSLALPTFFATFFTDFASTFGTDGGLGIDGRFGKDGAFGLGMFRGSVTPSTLRRGRRFLSAIAATTVPATPTAAAPTASAGPFALLTAPPAALWSFSAAPLPLVLPLFPRAALALERVPVVGRERDEALGFVRVAALARVDVGFERLVALAREALGFDPEADFDRAALGFELAAGFERVEAFARVPVGFESAACPPVLCFVRDADLPAPFSAFPEDSVAAIYLTSLP